MTLVTDYCKNCEYFIKSLDKYEEYQKRISAELKMANAQIKYLHP